MPQGVMLMNKEGYGILCNQKWTDLTGWGQDEFHASSLISLLSKNNRHLIDRFDHMVGEFFSKTQSKPITVTFIHDLTGIQYTLHLSGSSYLDKYGMLFAVDLSGEAEDQARMPEDQVDAMGGHRRSQKLKHWDRILIKSRKVAMIGGWEYDLSLNLINFTEEIYEIFEVRKDEFDVLEFYNFFLDEHRMIIERCITGLLTHGETYDVELRLKTGKGKIKWIRSIGQAERKGHEVAHVYGIIQDITERKEREEIHQASERLFNVAFQLAPIGIGLVSPEGNWLKINAVMISFFEYPENVLVTIPLGNLWPNEDLQKVFANSQAGKYSNGAYVFEKEYVSRENKVKWGRVNINEVRNEHGQLTYYIVQIEDITANKKFEEGLIAAKKEAEEANNAKSRFLSTISHEIRTPLYGVIGMTNLLTDEISDPNLQEQLEALKFSSESLLLMVNDILDFSKLKSGVLTLEYKPFNLKRLIEAVKESNIEKAKKLGNKISLNYDPELPVRWAGDKLRIGQILNNLIRNAVKFTKNGTIDITVKGTKMEKRWYHLSFSIKDTGIGIPKHLHSTIFDQFVQADSGTTRKYGGTGLGLPIVKGLLEAMNSEPVLESKPGRGTTVSFELRLLEAKKEQPTRNRKLTDGQKDLRHKKILLVEDNPVNMMVANNYIKKWNGETLIAENGLEAIKVFNQHKDEISLILMDLHMPVMNGFEATRRIKEIMPGIPVIALTASLGDKKIELASYGMETYIIKPFLPDEFYHIINTYMQ